MTSIPKVKGIPKLQSGFSLPFLVLSGVVAIAEFGGVIFSVIQTSITQFAATGYGTAILGFGLVVAGFLDFFAETDIISVAVSIFLIPFILSCTVFVVFCFIVAISPKGKYTLMDVLVAFGVFIIESIPFIAGFTGWSGFLGYLKWREKTRDLLPDTGIEI